MGSAILAEAAAQRASREKDSARSVLTADTGFLPKVQGSTRHPHLISAAAVSLPQNGKISAGNFGKEISVNRLAEIFLMLQAQGAHNINLVNPTHYLHGVYWLIRLTSTSPGRKVPAIQSSTAAASCTPFGSTRCGVQDGPPVSGKGQVPEVFQPDKKSPAAHPGTENPKTSAGGDVFVNSNFDKKLFFSLTTPKSCIIVLETNVPNFKKKQVKV